MQLQPSDALPKIMLARYYSNQIARFLSRDPVVRAKLSTRVIQRWNGYSYVRNNPMIRVDPNGMEEFTVTVTTAIPGTTIREPRGAVFRADGSAASVDSKSFRSRHSITIETNPIVNPSGRVAGGESKEMGSTTRITPAYFGAKNVERTASTDGLKSDTQRIDKDSVSVNLSGDVGNPLSVSPNINYNISLEVSENGDVEGSVEHDGFPSYDVTVTDSEGNTTSVFSHDPRETGEGAMSLFPPMEHSTPVSTNVKKPE